MTQIYSRLTVRRAAGLLILAAAAAGLSGCLESGEGRSTQLTADPNSQVTKDVLYASAHPGPFPKFSDIPKVPTDVPPASAWRAQVADLQRSKARLDAEAAALPPAQSDTEPFAASSRALAKAPVEAAPPDAEQQTEADAAALRERATPPPAPISAAEAKTHPPIRLAPIRPESIQASQDLRPSHSP